MEGIVSHPVAALSPHPLDALHGASINALVALHTFG